VPYVPIHGGQIFYTEEGSGGKAMLMIHGWSCDGSDWSWMASEFCKDHRCVMIDNRGHGRSTESPEGYSPRKFAQDAASVIETLQLERPIVVGHSMGTIIASTLAVERPDLVDALVLIDPVYGADDEALGPALQAIRTAPHAVAVESFKRFYGEMTPNWLITWHRRRILAQPEGVVRDALIGLYEGEEGIGRKVIGQEYLGRRRAPILAIYAGAGAATSEWDRALDHGPLDEIQVWKGNGHFLHQEQPQRFAAEVRRWLRGLPSNRVTDVVGG
jgi:pimeloyl-ACP methyl ester carboxylesterase